MTSTRNAKLGTLHALKREQRLDDDAYRDKLFLVTGHRSAKDCSDAQLDQAIAMFHTKRKTNNAHTAKVVAHYLAVFNMGGFSDGSDRAIDAFVQRQTGKATLRFLTPAESNSVTEALKAMGARLGFVVPPGDAGGLEARKALLVAQWARLHTLGAVGIPAIEALERYVSIHFLGHRGSLVHMSIPQLDAAAKALGRWIRKAQAGKAAPPA